MSCMVRNKAVRLKYFKNGIKFVFVVIVNDSPCTDLLSLEDYVFTLSFIFLYIHMYVCTGEYGACLFPNTCYK